MKIFVNKTLEKVNFGSSDLKFTPKLLRTMNVTHLQIVINEILEFRNTLNETLVRNLLERDELTSKRDVMLKWIEKHEVK